MQILINGLNFFSLTSDHGISGIMPFEVSNGLRGSNGSGLCVVHSFMLMDTSSGIIPYLSKVFNVSFLVVPTTFRTAWSMPLIGGPLRACACKNDILKAVYYGIVLSVK